MKKIMTVAALCLLNTGCVVEERVGTYHHNHRVMCEEAGYRHGTPAFEACLERFAYEEPVIHDEALFVAPGPWYYGHGGYYGHHRRWR